ncbi:hypothetical protein [Rubritalea tangerina]|uniref:hypothetical protein n=1 Tax=Rubritalea tangerina TaxID=430798 RepID=UPI0036105060
MSRIEKQPLEALSEYFGFDGFLDGQQAVVEKILTGEDGLVVMPTGGESPYVINCQHCACEVLVLW